VLQLRHFVATFLPWRPAFTPCGICGGRSGKGQVFLRVLRFFPVHVTSLLLSFHSCTVWRIDNHLISGRRSSTETVSPQAVLGTHTRYELPEGLCQRRQSFRQTGACVMNSAGNLSGNRRCNKSPLD
jgi:hypothetical protein